MARTIVALFDSLEQARAAAATLAGDRFNFTENDIELVTAVPPGMRGAYADAVRAGGGLLAVRALGEQDETAIAILKQFEPVEISSHPFSWHEQGWEGLELNPSQVENKAIEQARIFYRRKNS